MNPLRLFALLLPLGAGPALAQSQPVLEEIQPDYVGSALCSTCHEREAASWKTSHHHKAWTLPSPDTVLGDFESAGFEHQGRVTRFFRDGNGYFIETADVEGAPQTFKVVGVAGVDPLQQYLVETDPGRIQTFDVAWDREKKRWYHLYPDQMLTPGDGLHWTGPYKNWNARCAECHATEFKKFYDMRGRSYSSVQSEIGVGCEACHGPGSAHVAWAGTMAASQSPFPGANVAGLSVAFTRAQPQTEIQQCAGCHSRREPFDDGNPVPGTLFHDSYRLALLRDGLYHADGTILDEVYVYGSFLQSKMHSRGVRCSNCHEPHSGALKAEGNAVCKQCHSLAANADFPSLKAKLYDDPSHHFHEVGSPGAQCASCHMIERTYMGIDGRRDHSFRVPRPGLSVTTGAPNACTDCHTDKDATWARDDLALRFPNSAYQGAHFSEVFTLARRGSGDQAEELLALALHDALPGIVRATALDLLRPLADSDIAGQTAELLEDEDPLVRGAALPLQQAANESARLGFVIAALQDPVKAVRIVAARQMLGLRIAHMPDRYAELVKNAMRDWQSSLRAKSDFPETHMVSGGTALSLRNFPAALHAFKEAVELDPQLVQAWSMIVRLQVSSGDMAGAQFSLQRALKANPKDPGMLDLKEQFLEAMPSNE